MNRAATIALACMLMLLSACTSVRPEYNAPLQADSPQPGYRMRALPATPENGNALFVATSFSGGGARAAALAYGVLLGMRETVLGPDSRPRTLFDELDIVSAVSGGSLAAGYLAMKGDGMFPAFFDQVLMRDLHSAFIGELLKPRQWGWMLSPRFGRGDVLAEFLDREVFEGTRYADVLRRGSRPLVVIGATDMSQGSRFEFLQDPFDMLCSDLGSLKLATAVAASAAVPIVLSPITLRNHAAPCPQAGNINPYGLLGNRQRARLTRQTLSYLDKDQRPYIHLLDGGLSDNLATRGPLESVALRGSLRAVVEDGGLQGMRSFVFIVVNAEGQAGQGADRSEDVPSIFRVARAVADIPLGRYSSDSQEQLREALALWSRESPGASGWPLRTYYIEVSLQSPDLEPELQSLGKLPTALSLPQADVSRLVQAGRRIFHQSPDLARLREDLKRVD
jgi:NTE family protein